MTAQVIPLRQYDQKPQVLKKPINLSYEIAFIRNLLIWLVAGAILGVFIPQWIIWTGLIGWLYLDGKRNKKELQKQL